MAIDVQINAVFNIDGTTYTASMALPTSSPTATEPFLFQVLSNPTATPTSTTPLLTVAVGATNEIYVAVAPPTSLITAAAGSDIVSALDVQVSEGNYNPATKQFGT